MPLARSGVATHLEVRFSAPRPPASRALAAERARIGEASPDEMRGAEKLEAGTVGA